MAPAASATSHRGSPARGEEPATTLLARSKTRSTSGGAAAAEAAGASSGTTATMYCLNAATARLSPCTANAALRPSSAEKKCTASGPASRSSPAGVTALHPAAAPHSSSSTARPVRALSAATAAVETANTWRSAAPPAKCSALAPPPARSWWRAKGAGSLPLTASPLISTTRPVDRATATVTAGHCCAHTATAPTPPSGGLPAAKSLAAAAVGGVTPARRAATSQALSVRAFRPSPSSPTVMSLPYNSAAGGAGVRAGRHGAGVRV